MKVINDSSLFDTREIIQAKGDLDSIHGSNLLADYIGDMIVENENYPLEVVVKLKRLNKAITNALDREDIKKHLIKEHGQYSGNSVDILGAKVSNVPVYTEYDFSDCDHPGLEAAKSIVKELTVYIKETEALIKNLSEPLTICVETLPKLYWIENGELVEVKPAVKHQKYGLKFEKI